MAKWDSLTDIQALRKIAFAPPSQKISTSDRLRALELLGKTLALFTERHALESNVPSLESITDEERADLRETARIMTEARSRGMSVAEYLQDYQSRRLPRYDEETGKWINNAE